MAPRWSCLHGCGDLKTAANFPEGRAKRSQGSGRFLCSSLKESGLHPKAVLSAAPLLPGTAGPLLGASARCSPRALALCQLQAGLRRDWMPERLGGCRVSLRVPRGTLPLESGQACPSCLAGQGAVLTLGRKALGQSPVRVGVGVAPVQQTLLPVCSLHVLGAEQRVCHQP